MKLNRFHLRQNPLKICYNSTKLSEKRNLLLSKVDYQRMGINSISALEVRGAQLTAFAKLDYPGWGHCEQTPQTNALPEIALLSTE